MSTQRLSTRTWTHCGRMLALTAALVMILAGGGTARADTTLTFQQGDTNGYTGAVDTYIYALYPTTPYATDVLLTTDGTPPTEDERQILIRFDNIFGNGPTQIPAGSIITSATLTVNVSNAFGTNDYVRFNRMKQAWNATDTWNTFGASPWNGTAGIQADDVEAVAAADVTVNNIPTGLPSITVTTSLQAWAAAPTSNFGWVLRSGYADSLAFDSSEVVTVANRPRLTVVFKPPCQSDTDCNDGIACTTDTCNTGTGVCSNVDGCTGGQACNRTTGLCETAPALPINIGDTWKYFEGTTEPSAPVQLPPIWAGLGFVDASWLSGPSGFGYGATGSDCEAQRTGGTNLSGMQNNYWSVYIRRKFYIGDPAIISTLTLTMYFDDGFVAYLNGQEVARNTLAGTPPTYNTAATDHECTGGVTFTLDKSKLVTGINVIAIQGHNITLASSDFVLAPKLEATTSGCTTDAQCSDGLWCNGFETCNQTTHACQPGTAPNCDDGIACTTDSCDEVNDQCVHTPNNAACNDSNPCTDDTCVAGTGCVHTNNTASCDDGNACTTNDTCSNGSCVGGTAPNCDDGIACTTDGCNSSTGCTHTDNCTGGQTCNHTTGLCSTGPGTKTFQQGDANSYAGTVDTYIDTLLPSQATTTPIVCDNDPVEQVLIRFDGIFGASANQIPQGSTILSATLTLRVGSGSNDQSANAVNFHRLLHTWVATGVWADYGASPWNATGGIQADGTDAVATAEVTATMSTASTAYPISVTGSVQAWASNPSSNCGWVILPTGTDGLRLESSESTTASYRPLLAVNYTPPITNCTSDEQCNDGLYCNGLETCNLGTGLCQPGTAPNCDDGIACTTDSCNESTDTCTHTDNCTGGQICNHTTGLCETPQAPDQPTNPSPGNGATGVALSPDLCASVSDGDNDPLTVTFYGRAVTSVPGDPFTIVVLPDPQNYTTDAARYSIYSAQTQWCVDNRASRNIVFVTCVGDMTNDNNSTQWGVVNTAFSLLENPVTTGLPYGIPYGLALGNHDGSPDTTSLYNQTFSSDRFSGRSYYGGQYGTDNDNHYELFSASGMDFIVFHLECEMGSGYDGICTSDNCQAVLAWMDNLLTTTYANRRAIVVSHALMQPTGNPPAFMGHGQSIYDTLKDRPNFFMMLCGHWDQANHRVDLGTDNHPIYSLIQDYQGRSNGGDGWLRIMTFNPQADTIHVETYSPMVGAYINKPTAHADNLPNDACARDCYVESGGSYAAGGNELLLPYAMEAGEPFVQIGQLTGVASGSRPCVSWPGRAMNKQYEWYVTVSDGISTTTGSRWTFTTTTTCSGDGECDDSNPCTDDTCNLSTHLCEHNNNSNACTDDGNPCTDDICSGGVCTHPADNTNTCSDNNACTTDACVNASCVSTYAPTAGCCTKNADCNDGNAGTTDTCETGTHTCSNVLNQTCMTSAECNDNDACTTDVCAGGNAAAIELNGTSQYISLGNDGNTANVNYLTNFGTNSFTIEGWFWVDAAVTTDRIGIFRQGSQGSYPQVVVQLMSGTKLAASVEASTSPSQVDTATPAAVTTGAWHHFAMVAVRDLVTPANQRLNLHLDGAIAESTPASAWSTYPINDSSVSGVNDPVLLGVARTAPGANYGLYLDGRLDEVRIWNYARSAQEILDNKDKQIASATGLVHRWAMNEGTGTTVADSGSTPTTAGQLVGATWLTSGVPALGSGTCQHTPVAGCCNSNADCDDGLFCNGVETCNLANHTCQPGTSPCDDHIACTTNSCNETTDQCTYTPNNTACNDSNPCTDDTCDPVYGDPVTGCVHTNNTAACNDGNACTTNDTCSGGACVGGPALNCDDGNVCTDDPCNSATGCVHTNNTATCDDSAWCTVGDHCASGSCVGTTRDCSDGITCTTDSCNEATDSCDHVLMAGYCKIDSACYANGAPNPANSCQVCNTALSTSAWSVAPNGTACNDGNACTSGDACQAGVCIGGPTCDDGQPCTADTCTASDVDTYALNFNGSADCVTMGQALGLSTATFTLEAWIRRDGTSWGTTSATTGTGGLQNVVAVIAKGRSEGDSSNIDCNYFFGIDANGRLAADFEQYESTPWTAGQNHPICSTAQIADQNWHHVAVTYDKTIGYGWRVYLDGVDVTAANGTATTCGTVSSCSDAAVCPQNPGVNPRYDSIQHFALGVALNSTGANPGGYFGGIMDEARVWNHARTAAQIRAGMYMQIPSAPGLIGRWGLNEGTGTTANDSTVPAENGGIVGSPVWVSDHPALGQCDYTPIPACCTTAADCNDGNSCTTDTCENNVCVHTNNTLPCDDGNSCTTSDTCSGGVCVGTPIAECCRNDADCNDGAACTTDACNTANVAAIELNGTSQYVNLGNDNNTDQVNYLTSFGTSSFTIEGWFWADTAADNISIFRQGSQNAYPQVVVQLKAGGKLAASVETFISPYVATQVDTATPPTFSLAAWHHFALAVVRDATPGNQFMNLYLDGVLMEGTPASLWGANPINDTISGGTRDAVWLGAVRAAPAGSPTAYFDGRIDEIRIWDYARTAQQISNNKNKQILSAPGLRHRWAMNDGSGTTTADTGSTPTIPAFASLVNSPMWRTLAADIPTFGNDRCTHTLNAGVCLIDSACYADGTENPSNPCQMCNATANPNGWTNKANGVTCSDGNACTQTDTCQAGACVGANPVVCTASDQCHNVGTCDPGTGVCSNPLKTDGTTCNDGDACTQTDTCQGGVCTGSNPVACTAQDQCHDIGTCNPATGVCSNPPKTDGTTCNDSNACTQIDTCQGGTCVGTNPVVCTALDECHDIGTCNPATGTCSDPPKTNGSTCDDGNACTQADTCQAGVCTGTNPVVCTALDQCHNIGTCDSGSGVCSNPLKADGTGCNDGDACTQTDTCQTGVCTGSNPVACTASDQCHDAGTCDPGTGVCSNPPKENGTACNDGNACTQTDACQAGVCTGSNPVICTASDQCHDAGTCNPGTGVCSNPPRANGSACNDNSVCTENDVCSNGLCAGTQVNCNDGNPCTNDSCDPELGCQHVNNTLPCNDNNACTTTDTCLNGACVGGSPLDCDDLNPCTADSCDPVDGCVHEPLLQGTLDITVEIQGLTFPVTRPVTFVICDGAGQLTSFESPVAFTPAPVNDPVPRGTGNVTLTGIDRHALSIKATEGHTLSRVLPISFGAGCTTHVYFTAAANAWLSAGDFSSAYVLQNNYVDIQDFAILAINWNMPVDPNEGSLADVNGDGNQGVADFGAIQYNFATSGQWLFCSPYMQPAPPHSAATPLSDEAYQVTVRELGIPGAEAADRNHDGIIDVRDIRLFAAEKNLRLIPAFSEKLDRIERATIMKADVPNGLDAIGGK